MNYEKALATIESGLMTGETVVMKQKVNYKSPKNKLLGGALVLTSQRVRFVGSLMLDTADFSIPLNAISSIDTSRAALNKYTTITSASAGHRFLAVDPKFVAAIDHARHAPVRGGAPAAGPSAADEIGKFAALHASGALTAEEFAAAKARILGV